MQLEARGQDILKMIVFSSGYLKIDDIAHQLGVSRRSIYYDIQKINHWLKAEGIDPLVQERQKGIALSSYQVKAIKKRLFDPKEAVLASLSPDERINLQICATILHPHLMYIEDYMSLCDVSRNTIVADLKAVNSSLESYQLHLHYSIKTGYTIAGDLIRQRAVFFLLFPTIWNAYQQQLDENQVKQISQILTKLKAIETKLKAEYVSGILPALAVFITHLQPTSEPLTLLDMDVNEISDTQEYTLIAQYFPDIEQAEKIYLSLHLLGSRLQTVPVHIIKNDTESARIAHMLVNQFEKIACTEFERRDELIRALQTHLKTSLYRYRYGIQLGNPLLSTIQTEYADLFSLTKKAFSSMETQIGFVISDAEIAYLTLHFGAFMTNQKDKKNFRILIICPNGIGTGNMLKTEVAQLIPDASEITNLPLSSYHSNHGYDVVISTVPLANEPNFLLVHPILTDQDRVSILRQCIQTDSHAQMAINDIVSIASQYIAQEDLIAFRNDLQSYYSSLQFSQAPRKNFGLGLSHYLRPTHIQICTHEYDWKEAIIRACRPLLFQDSITQSYIDAIIRDQEKRHLYMFLTDYLVLAHSGHEGVKKTDVALTTFKQPVTFLNGQQAKVIISLCAQDQTKHLHVLNDILHLFSQAQSIEQLVSLDSPSDISRYISHHTLKR